MLHIVDVTATAFPFSLEATPPPRSKHPLPRAPGQGSATAPGPTPQAPDPGAAEAAVHHLLSRCRSGREALARLGAAALRGPLARCVTLDVHVPSLPPQALQLAQLLAVSCRNLRKLSWRDMEVNARVMAQLTRLPALSELNLQGGSQGDAALQGMAPSRRLHTLSLGPTVLGRQGVAGLVRLPALACLRLHDTSLDGFALQALGRALPALQALQLSACRFEPVALASLGSLKALQHLQLARCDLRGADLRFCSNLPALRSLDFTDAQLCARALPRLRRLTDLRLAGVLVDDDDVPGLLAACPSLQRLDLSCSRVGDRGAAALAQADLREVALYHLFVTEAGARPLAALPHLERLGLCTDGLSTADARALQQLLGARLHLRDGPLAAWARPL